MDNNSFNDERLKAQLAKEEEITLFDKIVRREIPANIIFEDSLVSINLNLNNSVTCLSRCATSGPFPFLSDSKKQNGSFRNQESEQRPYHTARAFALRGFSCGLFRSTS